jgi:uncharacterized protein (DUF1810 family)
MGEADDSSVDEFAHFIHAQEAVYDRVVRELTEGRKQSHWMWFIFPQLQGLGHSAMARRFALQGVDQARRYAAHPVLGHRLRRCTQLVQTVPNLDATAIFGTPDDLKFRSCLTLFARAQPESPLFTTALRRFFGGGPDTRTLQLLEAQR